MGEPHPQPPTPTIGRDIFRVYPKIWVVGSPNPLHPAPPGQWPQCLLALSFRNALNFVLENTDHTVLKQRQGCAKSLGFFAVTHGDAVMEKLSTLAKRMPCPVGPYGRRGGPRALGQ